MEQKNIIYIVGIIILALVLWWAYGYFTRAPLTNESLQQQIENSPELKEVVNSPRNNFKAGSYTLDAAVSKVVWKYGTQTGELPVSNGSLSVLSTGRIEGFTVAADLGSIGVDSATKAKLALSGTATMKASTVLPNTVDEAFTVAFSLEGAGKSTSLATGMYVTHEGEGVKVAGDVTIDPKTLGFTDATETLTISPVYVFK